MQLLSNCKYIVIKELLNKITITINYSLLLIVFSLLYSEWDFSLLSGKYSQFFLIKFIEIMVYPKTFTHNTKNSTNISFRTHNTTIIFWVKTYCYTSRAHVSYDRNKAHLAPSISVGMSRVSESPLPSQILLRFIIILVYQFNMYRYTCMQIAND